MAVQVQEEPHPFPENQCIGLRLINLTFKNLALILPEEKLICGLSFHFHSQPLNGHSTKLVLFQSQHQFHYWLCESE